MASPLFDPTGETDITYDLPSNFFTKAQLLDANYGFGLQDTNVPTSKIFIERYAAKKGDYTFLPIGTPSLNHTEAFLFEESNFRDIGGGLMTFERKYAQIPEEHEELVTSTVRVGRIAGVDGADSGSTFNFLGGDLTQGVHYINTGGEPDRVNVWKSATYDVPAIRKTKYFLKVTNEGESSQGVIMDNTSEIMNLEPEERLSYSVEKFYFGGVVTVRKLTRTEGSKFKANTIFRRVNGGRYLGEIYKLEEYRLLNDTITSYGQLVSDNQIEI